MPTFSAGAPFGHYEILDHLGAGGMGEVYRARDNRLQREVAIKVLPGEQSDSEASARLEREARAACALNHPNIVTIYELGRVDERLYIAMEYVRGKTVRNLMNASAIPLATVLDLGCQIADALAKAHQLGITHRDLKPENLMITDDGRAKVLDFGLAQLEIPQNLGASTQFTQAGVVVGTIGYMSPEQATGGAVDFRSDQFALGAVLYEMLSGVSAFSRPSAAETIAAILRDQPDRTKLNGAPSPLIWIIERCLSKKPESRYASTRELARDLAAVNNRLAPSTVFSIEPRSSVPMPRTTFIGRATERFKVGKLLTEGDVRILTVTGPGGIGKSRFALQVAAELTNHFEGGICFVDLSAVPQDASIAPSIIQALGVRDVDSQSPEEVLRLYFSKLSAPFLLLLDNCEHVITAASFVTQLLTTAPKIIVLGSSRAPLHLYGEKEFPLSTLPSPARDSHLAVEDAAKFAAVELFCERARAVKPEFRLTKENVASVCEICRCLDGLPLALELAAARIKLLSPAAMLARLESRLSLLTGGARDLPVRQRALRSTIDWSYELLSPAEQKFFARLSVFSGGCTLEAVEAVCDARGDVGIDTLDGVNSLLDKSLLQQSDERGSETRFSMLLTIREYAGECLSRSGDEEIVRRAHAAYFIVLAEEAAQAKEQSEEWLDRLELEHENLRLALETLLSTGNAEWALRLGVALFRFWDTREHFGEGREAITRILNLPDSSKHASLRARLLFATAVLAGQQGEFEAARGMFEQSLNTYVEIGDQQGVAVALNALAVNARDRDDLGVAALLLERCTEIWTSLGDHSNLARAVSNLARIRTLQRKYRDALDLYEKTLSNFTQIGDTAGVAWTLNSVGNVSRELGDLAAARTYFKRSLAAFQDLADNWGIGSALADLAAVSFDEGDNQEAARLYAESARVFRGVGHSRGVARVLECTAISAAARNEPIHALRIAGAAAALRKKIGVPLTSVEERALQSALEFSRRSLDSASSLAAWLAGWEIPLDRAIEEAFGERPTLNPPN
jgi:predicted ATPase